MAQDLITLRNKKTGQVIQVPRSQYSNDSDSPEEKGFSGIGSDIASSLATAPDALINLVSSIPGGAKNAYKYATTKNPVETLGNIGAGIVESGAQLASAPQVLTRYIANKFSKNGKSMNQPTIYEALMNFEKKHGLGARSEEEGSVRSLGGLVGGGGLLNKLPNSASKVGLLSAQQAGAGGDPLHGALLGALGERASKIPYSRAKEIPGATVNTVKNFPEIAGNATSAGIDTLSGLGSAAHIPFVPSALEALSDYIRYKSVKPETVAQKKLFSDIESSDLPKIQERLDAAKRLGLTYLTPAEASLSPFEAAKQGEIGRTSSGSKLMLEKGQSRTSSEGMAINNLLDTIYDRKSLRPQMQAAYEKTMEKSVPEDFISKHSVDPLVEHAMKELESKPVYKKALGDVPRNSFEYWDMVKRVLGDMEESAKGGTGRKPYEASVIGDTRRAMVDEMDSIEPDYQIARSISEREFTRNKLEKFFDKKEMTGNNFSKFLASKKNFKETMQKLKAFPDAQQKLKDMKLLFGQLIPNDMSIRSSAALKRTSMSEARNKVDAMKKILDEKYGKSHDVAAVNLMTNPNWVSILTKYLKDKGK